MSESILVVDDEPELVTLLSDTLGYERYRVVCASSGEEAMAVVARESPNLVILDVMLPGMSGLEVCGRLRRSGFLAPIIMLTARNTEIDRITGLEIGANDYVGKPFSIRELIARVRANLRRTDPGWQGTVLTFGDLVIDIQHRSVRRDQIRVMLSPHEYKLLQYLVLHRGSVVTREDLLNDVWGYSAATTSRTVDNFVAKLRRKIEQDPDLPRHIVTVHGVGYEFPAEPSA